MIFITPGSKLNPLLVERAALDDLKFMLDGMEERLKEFEGEKRTAYVLACRRWLHSGWPDVFPGVFITEVPDTATTTPLTAGYRDIIINDILKSLK